MRRLLTLFLLLVIGLVCMRESSAGQGGATNRANGGRKVVSRARSCADQWTPAVTTTAVTDTMCGPWERPMTLESDGGDDIIPCACDTIHPNFRNDTTDEAFQNLIDATNLARAAGRRATTAVIVGHGENGGLCTGNGEDCSDIAGNRMTSDNIREWAAKAALLKRSGVIALRILACGVGAGRIGKRFVHDIANKTGLIVYAPDCLVHCEPRRHVALVRGGKWYDSTMPLPDQSQPVELPQFVLVRTGHLLTRIAWNDVSILDFKVFHDGRIESVTGLPKTPTCAIPIAFDHPLQAYGEPLGVITGSVTLGFGRVAKPRTYQIYADVAARDPDDTSIYYPVSSALSDHMAMQRLRRVDTSGAPRQTAMAK